MRVMPSNWPPDLPVPPPIPKHYFEGRKWITAHAHELAQEYPDQWVAVYKGQVVAAGKDLSEVLRLAHECTGERDIAVELVSSTRMFYAAQS